MRAAIAPEQRGKRRDRNTKEWSAARSEALPGAERSLAQRQERARTARDQLPEYAQQRQRERQREQTRGRGPRLTLKWELGA